MPMSRRSAGTFHEGMHERSLPATYTVPRVGATSLSTIRIRVDLPDPEAPTRNTNSPRANSMSRFSTAGRCPRMYVLVTSSKRITGARHFGEVVRTQSRGAGALIDDPVDRVLVKTWSSVRAPGHAAAQESDLPWSARHRMPAAANQSIPPSH